MCKSSHKALSLDVHYGTCFVQTWVCVLVLTGSGTQTCDTFTEKIAVTQTLLLSL